ncbi:EF-hand domain-containing protein [Kiritimatiellaeota bacterium B1221]|nr:EF-hand domain-containing protein [Kiritimatiellaeota bacterium B1221]
MKTTLTAMILLFLAAGSAMAQPGDAGKDGKKPPSAKALIEKLDKDGDGKISKTEFDGPAEHFTQFDVNKDEFLTEEELPSGPPAKGGRR